MVHLQVIDQLVRLPNVYADAAPSRACSAPGAAAGRAQTAGTPSAANAARTAVTWPAVGGVTSPHG